MSRWSPPGWCGLLFRTARSASQARVLVDAARSELGGVVPVEACTGYNFRFEFVFVTWITMTRLSEFHCNLSLSVPYPGNRRATPRCGVDYSQRGALARSHGRGRPVVSAS